MAPCAAEVHLDAQRPGGGRFRERGLVGAGGMAYEEAAQVCQCAVGTIKSRVSRARRALEVILNETNSRVPSEHEIGADMAFDDILGQAAALAGGGVRARGDD